MTLPRLLLLIAALCVPLTASESLRTDQPWPSLQTPSSLRVGMRDLCAEFVVICDYVNANCDPKFQTLDQNAKCLDSFNLYYQHSVILSRCIQELPADSSEKTNFLAFLELYSAWQEQNACNLFHATEAKAALECSSIHVDRSWKQTVWPLYCHEVFTMYKDTRHKLDQFCSQTANSEAFWEGFADYTGTSTCRHYYDLMREAREQKCGEEDEALHGAECRQIFQWYKANQQVIETDCYELKASKPFYRGFYAWKKHQSD